MNNKFSNDIPQSEKDLYFNHNKEVLGLSEFTKNYINQVLKEENKQEFEKQDYELMKGYVENLVKYQNITEEIIGEKVNIKIVEKFILGQSIKEFEEFLIENYIIINLIEFGKKENVNIVWKIFEIKTKEDLLKLVKIREVFYLIKNGIEENFKKLFELKGFNKEMLIELVKIKEVVSLIEKGRKENLNKVWDLFEIKTKEDLLKLAKNEKIVNLIKYGREEYFIDLVKIILNNYSLKEVENLENIKKELFRVNSNGSKVLDELFEKMKVNKEKSMYSIMQEDSLNSIPKRNFLKILKREILAIIYTKYSQI